jgi:hypothetical protein
MLFSNLPAILPKLPLLQFTAASAIFNLLFFLVVFLLITRALSKSFKCTTPLRGPRNPSFIFGHYRHVQEQNAPELVYEQWAAEYGPAYQIAGPLGSKRIVICDPKANAHFYSRETYGYVQMKLAHVFIENLVSPKLELLALIKFLQKHSGLVRSVRSGGALGRSGQP